VMITFGATRPSATYAADAIAAAGELLRSLTSWRDGRRSAGLPAPGFGIGISSGTVIYGAIGDEGRLEYTVIGDAVNRAAKIQNHTRAIDVRALVSSETIDIAIAQGLSPRDFRAIPKTVIAGIAGAIDLVALG